MLEQGTQAASDQARGVGDWLAGLKWSLPPDEPTDHGTFVGGDGIILAGLPGGGKKTLCNTLWGWNAITAPGDAVRRYGRLTLIDLPADTSDMEQFSSHFAEAQITLYVLDAKAGMSSADFEWAARLRALKSQLVVVANKIDLLDKGAARQLLATLRERLNVPVLAVNAQDVVMVQRVFLPALLKACPMAAESLASEISGLRQRVAWQMIARAAVSSIMLNLETGHDPDVALLVTLQLRLMRRIGGLYGFRAAGGYGRELLLMTGLRFGFRQALTLAARYPRLRAWMVSGTLAAVTTILIGRLALLYYSIPLPGWLRWL
ncbi:MAG: hypothetical protein IAE80_04815 [Anaerolinea sp.]|nr:hypothetical protein [Anaerolinea sp.]